MIDYIANTERIIGEIKEIEVVQETKLKDLIQELSLHLEKGIEEKRPEVIRQLKNILAEDTQRPRGQNEITVNLISLLIKKMRNKYFQSISDDWIEKCLDSKYKEKKDRGDRPEKQFHVEEISDGQLLKNADEIKKRLRTIQNLGPDKEVKVKLDPVIIQEYKWKCKSAEEYAKLAVKMENEHEKEHKQDYCDKTAKILRMTRDKRYATTYSKYQAIVVQAEHSRSLANLAGDEVEVLSRWQVEDNEKNCRECLGRNECRASKCNHICHDFKKPMTTKGIKWALRETQELNQLESQMKKLSVDSDDMCDMMKMVFGNPNIKMTQGQKKSIMATHINKDKCDMCVYFEMEHPQFFREHLQ